MQQDSPVTARTRRLVAMFDAAFNLPPAAVEGFLAEAVSDESLRIELLNMLRFARQVEQAFRHDQDHPYQILGLHEVDAISVRFRARRRDQEGPEVSLQILRSGLCHGNAVLDFVKDCRGLQVVDDARVARLLAVGLAAGLHVFLVWERIDGRALLEDLDLRKVPVHQRISTFLEICDAVEVLHRAGFWHGLLAPEQILVRADGALKLVNAGIVPALEASLRKVDAPRRMVFGDPVYAAPEQVSDGTFDARTEVYALGVLLHLLLTGRPAIEPAQLRKATVAEIAASIRHHEQTPASVLAASGAATVAASRATTPRRLARSLQGELDGILARCLHHDPAQRYPTVSDLAADLRRYLRNEPVHAGVAPRSRRTLRFLRRQRLFLATSVAVALASGSISWGLGAASRDPDLELSNQRQQALTRDLELQRTQSDLLASMVAAERVAFQTMTGQMMLALRRRGTSKGLSAEQLVTEIASGADRLEPRSPRAEIRLRLFLGRWHREAGDLDAARSHYQTALRLGEGDNKDLREDLEAQLGLAWIDFRTLDLEAAGKAFTAVHEKARRLVPLDLDLAMDALNGSAATSLALHELPAAEQAYRTLIAEHEQRYGQDARQTIPLRRNLALTLLRRLRYAEAETLLRELLPAVEQISGTHSRSTAESRLMLAEVLLARGQFAEAQALCVAVHEQLQSGPGNADPLTQRALVTRAELHLRNGQHDRALEVLAQHDDRRSAARANKTQRDVQVKLLLVRTHLATGRPELAGDEIHAAEARLTDDSTLTRQLRSLTLQARATVALTAGERDAAENFARQAAELSESAFRPDSGERHWLAGFFGFVRSQREPREGEAMLQRAKEALAAHHGERHPLTMDVGQWLADVQRAGSKPQGR